MTAIITTTTVKTTITATTHHLATHLNTHRHTLVTGMMASSYFGSFANNFELPLAVMTAAYLVEAAMTWRDENNHTDQDTQS